MKLSSVIQNINQALNYPSLSYIDLDLFFNTAISELNTTLHTSLPSVSQMKDEFEQIMSKDIQSKSVVIPEDPTSSGEEIPVVVKYAINTAYSTGEYISHEKKLYVLNNAITAENNTSFDDLDVSEVTEIINNNKTVTYFYNADMKLFGIWNITNKCYFYYKTIYGIYSRNGTPERYSSYYLGFQPIWINYTHADEELDLAAYLPDDWVYLWLIPYVCYEYTVRDGGTAQTFAEKLTQGHQQLQDTYNVPDKVILATVAGKLAYSKLVEDNLANLAIKVPTRAIYETMKHERNINGIYGSMYDRGSFL